MNNSVTTNPPTTPYTPIGIYENDKFNWWNHKLGSEDEQVNFSSSIVELISYIVIILVILSFLAFLLCLCCPMCLLAKKRHRIRGHVYSRQIPGPIQIPSSLSPPVTFPIDPHAPLNIIEFRNNSSLQQRADGSRPYPVQQSVTIIPVLPIHISLSEILPPPPYPYPGYSGNPSPNPATTNNEPQIEIIQPQLPYTYNNPYFTVTTSTGTGGRD